MIPYIRSIWEPHRIRGTGNLLTFTTKINHMSANTLVPWMVWVPGISSSSKRVRSVGGSGSLVAAATDSGLLGKIFGFVAQPGLGPRASGGRKGDEGGFLGPVCGHFFGGIWRFFLLG